MKKILFAAMAAVAMLGVSCNCDSDSCSTETAANDSLSTIYGTYVGYMVNNEVTHSPHFENTDKAAFAKGFKMVMASQLSADGRYGMQVALQLQNEFTRFEAEGIAIDKKAVVDAFLAAFNNDSLTVNDIREAQQKAMMALQAAENAAMEAASQATQNTTANFIEEQMAQDPAIQKSASGLAYKIENQGDGVTPTETATVKVHYTGKHIDGSIFDSSVQRGEPATFNLQGVVPGFREGLMLLGKGGKATLYIPGHLAYGSNGTPDGSIKPNETLIFEVELLDFNE